MFTILFGRPLFNAVIKQERLAFLLCASPEPEDEETPPVPGDITEEEAETATVQTDEEIDEVWGETETVEVISDTYVDEENPENDTTTTN